MAFIVFLILFSGAFALFALAAAKWGAWSIPYSDVNGDPMRWMP